MKSPADLHDLIPHHLWIACAGGSVETVNDRWREITGMDASRSKGEGWLDAIHPDDRNGVWELWKRRIRDGRPI